MSIQHNRVTALRQALPRELDAVLVTHEISQRYLSDFPFTDGYLLITRDRAFLLTDARYIEAATARIPDTFEVLLFAGNALVQIDGLLTDCGATVLGYEDRHLSCAALTNLQEKLFTRTLLPIGDTLDALRICKDSTEIDAIERAQRIAEAALDALLGRIDTAWTEVRLAAELEYEMRIRGAESFAFETIAVSGTASSLPHGVPRNVPLEKGFLTMDFGAVCDGYRSDMTRTVCLGRADNEMKRIYQTVLDAQLAGLAALGPQIDCGRADAVARAIIAGAGYGDYFAHSLGHGVGLDIHEEPRLSKRATGTLLLPGHVVTVEPGIYLPGKYGVRIEDMAVITEQGARNLTLAPKTLLEI